MSSARLSIVDEVLSAHPTSEARAHELSLKKAFEGNFEISIQQ